MKKAYLILSIMILVFSNFYIISGDDKIASYGWRQEIGLPVKIIDITDNGNILVGASISELTGTTYNCKNKIYLFTNKGKLLWDFEEVSTNLVLTSMSTTSDGSKILVTFGRPQAYFDEKGGSYGILSPKESKAYLFDNTGDIIWEYKVNGSIDSAVIDPNGKFVSIATGIPEPKIILLDINRKLIKDFSLDGINSSPQIISPDGKMIYLFNGDFFSAGPIYFFSGGSWAEIDEINTTLLKRFEINLGNLKGKNLIVNSMSSDSSFIGIVFGGENAEFNYDKGGWDNSGFVYYMNKGRKVIGQTREDTRSKYSQIYTTKGHVESVCLSGDGGLLAVGTSGYWDKKKNKVEEWLVDGKLYLFDTSEDFDLLWEYDTGYPLNSVSISNDNSLILGSGEKVYLLNKEGKLLWESTEQNISNSIISKDGSFIIFADNSKLYHYKISKEKISENSQMVSNEVITNKNDSNQSDINATSIVNNTANSQIDQNMDSKDTKNTPGFELPTLIVGSILIYCLRKKGK